MNLSYIKGASDPLGDAGDPYTGYDCPPPAADDLRSGSASLHEVKPAVAAKQCFGRTVDMRWSMSSGGALRDEFLYGYDCASQRTWKSNYAATAGDDQDDFYNYDGLYQVTRAARGELNLNQTAISAIPAKEETFSYDPTGNWDRYIESTSGAVDLDQTRKNNKDNQLTQFDGSSDNVAYDKAGNATSMKPDKTGDWSKHYQLKWDGWNRLVEVKDSVDAVVATYAYDGLTRRITKTIGAVVTHFYFNDQWKCVEERKDSSTDAERQYAWGIQFRNDLILRDRDTTGNGTLDERLYATHDALGNCTAILNTSGAVQERYGYSAFGIRRIMQADFTDRASSSFAWGFGFQGEFLDDETGYINYGFRYYLPYVGKWISRDPIQEKGGLNLYLFVYNDGVNLYDRLGLDADSSPWGDSNGRCLRCAGNDPQKPGEDYEPTLSPPGGAPLNRNTISCASMRAALKARGAYEPDSNAGEGCECYRHDKGNGYISVFYVYKAPKNTGPDSFQYHFMRQGSDGNFYDNDRTIGDKNAVRDELKDMKKSLGENLEVCPQICFPEGGINVD